MTKLSATVFLLLSAVSASGEAQWPKDVRSTDEALKPKRSHVAYERHDVDDGTFVKVAFTNGFDVGQTCDKPDKGPAPGRDRSKLSRVEIVPAAEYVGAKVICSLKDDPKLSPTFTLRLTRYNNGPDMAGRSPGGVCDTVVDLRTASKKRRPDGKWEVDVPIDMGDHVGLVFWDRWGSYLNRGIHESDSRLTDIGNYMDVDILSCTRPVRKGYTRPSVVPDPARRSGVIVHGFTLERSPVVFEPRQFVPGNVFGPEDRHETEVNLVVERPGSYELAWTVTDAEGRVVGERACDVRESERKAIDLSSYGKGWFALDYRLTDKRRKRLLMTHHASFAVLGKDTRKEGIGEGPYGSWTYGGAHYTSKDIDFVGPLLEKAGLRRALGAEEYDTARRHFYKLSPASIKMPSGKMYTNEEQKVAAFRKKLETDPNCRSFLMFHETAVWGYQMAPELTGQPYDPKTFGWHPGGYLYKVDSEKDRIETEKQVRTATETARFLRKHFPQVYISLGNSLCCTELIARMIRNGLPQDCADYMGLESVVRNNLPERQWESSIQAADLMLQTAQAMGYDKWKVNSCFESCYRIDELIGADAQAAWYVRDVLLSQAWRFPDIFIGILIDCGNSYAGSFWGMTGLCHRMPYAYPKKSYVGLAVATKLLDRVRGVRQIPTGDNCVYAVEYTRADGLCVTALWTSQGEADVELDLGWFKRVRLVDFYGREQEKEKVLKVGAFVRYVVSDGPSVKNARCVRRRYPEDIVPKDAVVVARADDIGDWQMVTNALPALERTKGPFMPYRTAGKYALRQVTDAEMGKCLELELVEPDMKLPKVMSEYAVVELKKPIPLVGDPASIGMMVKGNSGWGQVGWVVSSKTGRRAYSLGRSEGADIFDYQGEASVAFGGWKFMKQIVDPRRSTVPDTTSGGGYVWNDWGAGGPEYPLKIVGVVFSAQNRPLALTERRPMRQVIRFKNIVTFDAFAE